MNEFIDSIQGLSVSELEEVRGRLQSNIDEMDGGISELQVKMMDVNKLIWDLTPRNLSVNEVERLLGFKVNITDRDKLRATK